MITNDLNVWIEERRKISVPEYEIEANRKCMEEILKHHTPKGLMTYPVELIEENIKHMKKYTITAKTRMVDNFESALDSLKNVDWYLLDASETKLDEIRSIRKVRFAIAGD